MSIEQFTIREARDDELEEVIQVISEGFTEDPVNNYIGGVKTVRPSTYLHSESHEFV